jgi:hypothetical protein
LGWILAHGVFHIRNPHWVQHGEHAALDVLGICFMLSSIPSFFACWASLLALPCTLIAQWRAHNAHRLAPWRTYLFILAITFPGAILVAMMRPFGGSAWGLVDWLPD